MGYSCRGSLNTAAVCVQLMRNSGPTNGSAMEPAAGSVLRTTFGQQYSFTEIILIMCRLQSI